MDARTLSNIMGLVRQMPLLGPSLRWLVRQYPEGSIVTIRSGAAKGLKWKRSHNYDPGVWLGSHEPMVQHALKRNLRPGDVFYDVGANAGFFSALAASIVGSEGAVVAVEPHPLNVKSIAAQFDVNGFKNVTLIPKAISSEEGVFAFSTGNNLSQCHLGTPRAGETLIEVQTITLDQILDLCPPPTHIKVDIEGGGVSLAPGAQRVAREFRPVWILEVHNREEEVAFKNLLLPLGYNFTSLDQQAIEPNERLPNHVIAYYA
jgi:FkbM family methyltransferase